MTLKCSILHEVKGLRSLGIILGSYFEISKFMQNVSQTTVFYGYQRIVTNQTFSSGNDMTKLPSN